MSDPSSPWRLPTAISIVIAVVVGTAGLLLWRSAAQAPDGTAGGAWLLQVALAGAALMVAALALYLASNRLVSWVGIGVLVLLVSL